MNGRPLLIATGPYAFLCLVSPTRVSRLPRVYAPETFALKALQTLNTAQVQYNSRVGRYTRSLAELGPSAANLILPDLASGAKQGYKFTLKTSRLQHSSRPDGLQLHWLAYPFPRPIADHSREPRPGACDGQQRRSRIGDEAVVKRESPRLRVAASPRRPRAPVLP